MFHQWGLIWGDWFGPRSSAQERIKVHPVGLRVQYARYEHPVFVLKVHAERPVIEALVLIEDNEDIGTDEVRLVHRRDEPDLSGIEFHEAPYGGYPDAPDEAVDKPCAEVVRA